MLATRSTPLASAPTRRRPSPPSWPPRAARFPARCTAIPRAAAIHRLAGGARPGAVLQANGNFRGKPAGRCDHTLTSELVHSAFSVPGQHARHPLVVPDQVFGSHRIAPAVGEPQLFVNLP